ncbi:MAG: hypothetical protein ACXQS5_06750 [Candidatus Methanospirareceae archaeon]
MTSLVLVEKRRVVKTTKGSYLVILPKPYVESNPDITQKMKVTVITGKYVVIAPPSISVDELLEIKRWLGGEE